MFGLDRALSRTFNDLTRPLLGPQSGPFTSGQPGNPADAFYGLGAEAKKQQDADAKLYEDNRKVSNLLLGMTEARKRTPGLRAQSLLGAGASGYTLLTY